MMKRFIKTFMAFALILSMVLPVLTPVASAAGQSGSGLKDYHSMTMEQIFASKEDLTWVMTGDSITHNGSWTQGMNSYTEWFEQYLYDIGRGDDAVINTAWGGADIQDFLYQKDTPGTNGAKADPGMGLEQFITKYNPDVVTVKLGMNNRGMTTASFVRYYKLMLDSIYAEGKKNGKIPKIIILTPTPMSGETIRDQAQEDQDSCWRFQRCLKEIAEEYDLLFVDLMTAFTTEATKLGSEYRATFFVDPSDGGIHPNAAGHYLIYKTFSKVLGIYDEKLPMYQYEYDELKYAALWQGSTGNVQYGTVNSVDKVEMGKTMPTVSTTAKLLSYIDFTAANGAFNAKAGSDVEMTDSALGDGALTLDEAKSLGKTFSVVFRARLDTPPKTNSAVLFLSGTDYSNWNNALTLSCPGNTNEVYYNLRVGGTAKVTGGNGRITMSGAYNVVNDDTWHTVAIVQTESNLLYYVDGKLEWTGGSVLTQNIGDLFASASAVHCKIGSYDAATSGYYINGSMDFWQLYGGALTAQEVAALSGAGGPTVVESTSQNWSAAFKENNLWVIAGAEQISGYRGSSVYRSLFRLLDNTMRNTSGNKHRDIRMVNASGSGLSVADFNGNYETLIGKYNGQVFLLLPEVSEVYADGYTHSAGKVSQYKDSVNALVAKAKADDMTVILWTPLASGNDTVNAYLDEYAAAVRQIAEADGSIMFFDANLFMNLNMDSSDALCRNWFEEEMYISPLCALDVARAFYVKCNECGVSTATYSELTGHDLRVDSDIRTVKGPYVRDYIASKFTVSGVQVTVDVSAIQAAYPGISKLRVAILPEIGFGNYSDQVWDNVAAVSGSSCTFTAPWNNCVITVYGELNGHVYRFKDQTVAVSVSNPVSKPVASATDLTDLKVVGAPSIGFSANTTTYNVNLYQYQSHVQIIGTAAAGQVITVNGEEVVSGQRSQIIEVDQTATVTVKANGKTYTLNLTRPEYPDIIITEVMQDTAGEKYDMLEIYNASGKELDLKDYSIGFKKDYSYASPLDSGNKWPYYFAGNDTGFHSTSSTATTQTGINPITKYSTYEPGGAKTEPASIPFPANSTMILWVRRSGTQDLTAQDLINDLTAMADTSNYNNKTLTVNGSAVVPSVDQIVVAEVPKGASSAGLSVSTNYQYGYLENHGAFNDDSLVRTWLFVLDANAVRHHHNAITAAGNDIYAAALLSRVSTSQNLSTVMYYDVQRGMSVVKDAAKLLGKPVTGYTSSQSGYMNLTTFGAIEYWQKPYDLDDVTAPTAAYTISGGKLTLTLKDDTDVRYFQLNLDVDNDGVFETTVTKDLVLESSAASSTGTATATKEYVYTYDLGSYADAQCYGYVLDGNNNKGACGAYGDLTVSLGGDETAAETDSIQVQIQLNKGDATIALDKSYDVVDSQGNVLGTISGNKLTGTVKLTNGQKLFVKGLPAGTAYTLTFEVPEGFKAIEAISGKVAEGIAPDVVLKLVAEESEDDPIVDPGDGSGNGGGTTDPSGPTDPSQPGTDPTDPSKPGGSGSTKPTDPSQPGEPEQPAGESYILWWSLLGVTIAIGAAIIGVLLVIAAKARKKK